MYTLLILGGFTLDGPPLREARGGLTQRRAEAVLATLAVAGPHGATRDRVVGLLWPEHDEARARHCLRNQLSLIRHSLGASVVLEAGGSMRLDHALVNTDVEHFEAAVAAGASEDAVSRYRGPLLDGFHVDGAAAFDRWMEKERTRLARTFGEQLEQLALTAEASDDWRQAAHWWWRAAQQDSYSTRCAIRLVRALVASGDRAQALHEAEAHARRLRTELEIEPDNALLVEIERIRHGPQAEPPPSRDSEVS